MKGIPLANELKTLVLQTGSDLVLAHVPGDRRLSLRKVKNILGLKDVCLASTIDLASIGMEPGTVCPFLETTRSLRALVDPALLDLDFVSTNDGTRFASLHFPPQLILSSPTTIIADCTLPLS